VADDKLIQFKGTIYENGYGLIAKNTMRDPELNIIAKGIYSYLCSYAGKESSAFPSIKLIQYELGISKNTFYKYMKELTDKGYIAVSQRRIDKGKFSHNVYSIEAIPCPKSADTVKQQNDSPCTKSRETVRREPMRPSPVRKDTINNNTTNNNYINNNNTSSSNKELVNKEIYDTYEKCGFGLINITIAEMLDADVEIFSKAWVIDAMKEAVRQNRYKLTYVEGILRNWKADGRDKKLKKGAYIRGNDKEINNRGDESDIGFHF
jgi:DnaD/phage-associated family protein